MSNYGQEKTRENERKRKAAYLEAIFDSTAKKQNQDHHNNNEGLAGRETKVSKHNGAPSHTHEPATANNAATETTQPMAVSTHRVPSSHEVLRSPQVTRSTPSHSNPEPPKAREKGPSTSEGNQFAGFQRTSAVVNEERAEATKDRVGEMKCAAATGLNNGVKVKQEQTSEDETLPVQLVSVQGRHEEPKAKSEEIGDVGDDYFKYLLFAGKLYHCERVSDLTHNYLRFGTESLHGRKGKVVVLLLFHKIYREVVNYVVGVIEHSTMEEQTIVVGIIKSHTYASSRISNKDLENKISKFPIGSKKLLYNLQYLDSPVYSELVKILDGFGANSTVDHSKISEFNAMINANADRLDNQLPNYLTDASHSLLRTSSGRAFVSPAYGYPSPCVLQSNSRYSPLTTRPSLDSPYSTLKPHLGAFSGAPEIGFSKPLYTVSQHHERTSQADRPVYTIAANETMRTTSGTFNSGTCVEHTRGAPSSVRFHGAGEEKITRDAAMSSQRRNVEDLQTVAELCKEKMKRDMAEQELKSIKAAFEEFKSQMQHHLSQVEERMVLLEAENRNLKGKLSNMHQTNGFAEKKYHELRSRLEDLLKST